MAVDPIGSRNSDAQFKAQKKSMEDERNQELARIERQYQDQVQKSQEARERSLHDMYDSQVTQTDASQRASEVKVQRVKEAAEQRIKDFEKESQRMTEEAQRQFQQKAANLNRNADELEKQRKFLLAQHADTTKKLNQEQQKTEREANQRAARQANEAYINSQKKLSELQNRGDLELQAQNDDFKARKSSQIVDGEMELQRVKSERDMHKNAIEQEMNFNTRTGKERESYQRILNENNLASIQSDYDGKMRDINRASRFQINSEIMKSRNDLDNTRSRASDEQRALQKQNEKRVLDAELQNQQRLGNLEDEAKLQQHIMTKSFQYQKQRFKEEADKNLEQYAEQNDKLRGELESNYRTQSANLKDKYKKQFNDQEHQLQHELRHQYVRGTSQINNLIVENANDQQYTAMKAEDPFYRVQRLNPSLYDVGDEYIVNMRMPAHEQEHVRLSHQKGLLTVSNNRRYEGQGKTDEGQSISTHTYQSYSESLPITGRVDITKMRRSYDNGILTFRLPKILV